MDPGIPVPPDLYGGHERLVYLFAEEYVKLGHTVDLLAGPNSKISGNSYSFGINDLKRSKWQRLKEVIAAWILIFSRRKEYDLVHNFGRLIYLLPILNSNCHKIMTYGRPVSRPGVKMINSLPTKNLIFTACSNYCKSTGDVAGKWKTVYNTINFDDYNPVMTVSKDAPFMFLGRLDKIKGCHTAINVALKTGNKLWIAGNISETEDNYKYFKKVIEPQIDDERIIYLGALNDQQKNEYLGKSKALLFPIEWDEPFGMVMIEAMACGTPVIGFKRGSVPEIIIHGENGFIVETEQEMIEATQHLNNISRNDCNVIVREKYNTSKIANIYLEIIN